jgi:hypothetical protein
MTRSIMDYPLGSNGTPEPTNGHSNEPAEAPSGSNRRPKKERVPTPDLETAEAIVAEARKLKADRRENAMVHALVKQHL